MDWLIFAGIVVALIALGFLAQKKGWIDLSNKSSLGRSGSGGGLAGIGDEVFHPARYESQMEMDRQTILPAPAPLAGDGDPSTSSGTGVYKGNVKLDLTPPKPVGARHRASESSDPDTRSGRAETR